MLMLRYIMRFVSLTYGALKEKFFYCVRILIFYQLRFYISIPKSQPKKALLVCYCHFFGEYCRQHNDKVSAALEIVQ